MSQSSAANRLGVSRNSTMVDIRGVHKWFGRLHVLQGITTSIDRGQVVGIIGASGSGKSTLLRCINHLEKIQEGDILVDGESVRDPGLNVNRFRAQIGMVFQHFNLFAHLRVMENVTLGPRKVLGKSAGEAKDIGEEALKQVGLSEKAKAYPSQISGGQQQRVAIARALAMQPKLLMFDEPTSALDPELIREVLDTIRRLAEQGRTMLLVTHEIAFAREICHRAMFLNEGLVAEEGAAKEVLDHPRDPRLQRFLGQVLR